VIGIPSAGVSLHMRYKDCMDQPGGVRLFETLPKATQDQHRRIMREVVGLAQKHAVPIFVAPPPHLGGTVSGATGCLVELRSGVYVITANHVLEAYERRRCSGEAVNWQVGKLPPFDPVPRIAWRDAYKDIVLVGLSADQASRIGPSIISTPDKWPPPAPVTDQLVLVSGYPKVLRQVETSGRVAVGAASSMFRVTTTGEGYCVCQLERMDLISYGEEPLPEPDTEMGG
jgi:hypothetical protein